MTVDASAFKSWVGQKCTSVRRDGHVWRFVFGEAGNANVECPWRIRAGERIALTNEDHDQKFGLPQPIDAAEDATKLLKDLEIVAVEIGGGTGDLSVRFLGDVALELWSNSSGYEAWQATVIRETDRALIVAQGGGEVVSFDGLQA